MLLCLPADLNYFKSDLRATGFHLGIKLLLKEEGREQKEIPRAEDIRGNYRRAQSQLITRSCKC